MKQHLTGSQLKEINYEDRIVLLSLSTGLTKEYMEGEYSQGSKREEDMLTKYGYDVKVGELIEIIEDYTGQFPLPVKEGGQYRITISWKDRSGGRLEADSRNQGSYCDALYEIVKILLKEKQIQIV